MIRRFLVTVLGLASAAGIALATAPAATAGLEEDGAYGPNAYNWVKFPAWSWPANVMQNSCRHSTI